MLNFAHSNIYQDLLKNTWNHEKEIWLYEEISSWQAQGGWISHLQIIAVLDKSHYLLADWYSEPFLFFGQKHIYRLNNFYLNFGKVQNTFLATVSNVKGQRDEV